MQPILTVGSVAFDSIKTPAGEVSRVEGHGVTGQPQPQEASQ